MIQTSRRLTAEIDLEAVRHNVRAVRAHVGPAVGVMAIVKADAYGHGAAQVSRAALDAGAAWLGVATVAEGVALREHFPDARIAHLPPFPRDACGEIVWNRLTPCVSDLANVDALDQAGQRLGLRAEAHLEVDTGMGRSGATPESAVEIAFSARSRTHVDLTGLVTHFAAADGDPDFTRDQIARFNQVRLAVAGQTEIRLVHAANSPATLLYPEAHYNLVRPGLLLYGILPGGACAQYTGLFRPALTLKTSICLLRELPAGVSLSYDRTYVLKRPSRIATLPVGYGDGYPRGLSNLGEVLISGRRAPIVGRVCMDVLLVDVTHIPEAQTGSEAVLIGRQGDDEIRVEDLARLLETTEHEITTRLTARVQRQFSV